MHRGLGWVRRVRDQTIPAVRRQDLQVSMLVPPSLIPDNHVSFNGLFGVVAAHAISPCGSLAKAVSWRKIDFVGFGVGNLPANAFRVAPP